MSAYPTRHAGITFGRALGDGQLGQPVARRNSGLGGLLATRIVHGLQGGFAPLPLQAKALPTRALTRGWVWHMFDMSG